MLILAEPQIMDTCDRVKSLADIGHSIITALISPWGSVTRSLICSGGSSHERTGKSF